MKEDQVTRVLIVDDEAYVREILSRLLTMAGYSCETACNGESAIKLLEKEPFDLVFCDIVMEGVSGLDLLMVVHALFKDVAVIMVSGIDDRKTAVTTLELGAYGYVVKPFDANEILISAAGAIERRRLTLLGREYERSLEQKILERTNAVKKREDEIIQRLVSALNYRDGETGAHARRIGLYAEVMAKELGWDQDSSDLIRSAGTMHDIGKIAIPDSILLKRGPLTTEEFEIMKNHTVIGAQMLDGSEVELLHMAREIAWCHHERQDGCGYPRKLVGADIPESAAIVAILDVYDSLVHERPYRAALPEKDALDIVVAANGNRFGNQVFDCFMSVLPELRQIREQVTEE